MVRIAIWLAPVLMPLVVASCLPYTTATLAVRDSNDVRADLSRAADVLRKLGFADADASQHAPKGSIGLKAYQGQFTLLAPEQDSQRIAISFSEIASKFSPRARATYVDMIEALRMEFGDQRIEAPDELTK